MRRELRGLAMLLAALAVLGGCASGPLTAPPPVPGIAPVAALVERLPPDLASSRTIAAGSPLSTAPLYFVGDDGATPSGLVVDLVEVAAAHLGLRVEWKQIPYPGLVPALTSGQVRIGGAQYTPTPENARSASIVTAYRSSASLLVRAAETASFGVPSSVCGRRLAVTRGSVPDLAVARDLAGRCGDAAPTIDQYAGAGDAELAVRAERADAYVLATPACRYVEDTYPRSYGVAPMGSFSSRTAGIALGRDDRVFAALFRDALAAARDDGSYRAVLRRWGVEDLAIPAPELSGPGAAS